MNIFELHGVFAEPWVARKREEIAGVLDENPSRGLLFNVREVERVDRLGAEAILETVRKVPKGGILGHNLSAYFSAEGGSASGGVAEHMNPGEPIPIFEREREAIGYFGKELALAEQEDGPERRRFPRIKTAFAAEFELPEAGQPFFFEAAVLNLSQGGLYGKFLDSRTQELAERMLNPFDLKMLNIRLHMEKGEVLKIEGKILRTGTRSEEGGEIAVEFYNLEAREGERIQKFLDREGESQV